MLDFLTVRKRRTREGRIEIYPDYKISRSKDLMVRGGNFYAIWNQELGLWSTDEYDVQTLVDAELSKRANKEQVNSEQSVNVLYMSNYSSGSWSKFKNYVKGIADHNKQLDTKITFSNSEVLKKDYTSMRLEYPIEQGDTPAFDELLGTLYNDTELQKIMWAIGALISGDSKLIQKFLVFFGAPGTGKSTVLNLIQEMFPGYYTSFEAKQLASGSNAFANESFRSNPLIGVNHEGDLSRVRDNSALNSLVSHDHIVMNVKYQASFSMRLNTMLFIATNKPVNITDANSGLIRRLIDVRPSGNLVTPDAYDVLVAQLPFEYGAIADKCLNVYLDKGKTFYSRYRPVDMILRTNVFYNFIDHNYIQFKRDQYVTLSMAWTLYREYCDDSNIQYPMTKHVFRDELRVYWDEFLSQKKIGGDNLRNVFSGFNEEAFLSSDTDAPKKPVVVKDHWLNMKKQSSLLDQVLSKQPAQYDGKHRKYWDEVTTTLADLQTGRQHYVLPIENLITIDFDLKNSSGDKDMALNEAAAEGFPPTYAELSKSGNAIHLQYYYDGDVSKLSRVYDTDIEVLAPIGKFSIRRKVTKCNDHPITTINSGLPLKGERMINKQAITTERSLRILVLGNLNKEYHANTRPSVDFIKKILEEAHASGVPYDITDMKQDVVSFALGSTNQSVECMKIALNLPYRSENESEPVPERYHDDRIVFFDIEVLPNLTLISWKIRGKDNPVHRMINPTAAQVEGLLQYKLVGFNNRRYDNHILYALHMGYTTEQIYNLSARIIGKDRTAYFREAYGLSHGDLFEYASKKQSLKKWQIELGLFHREFELSWDEYLPEELWDSLGDYCDNDVISLEATFEKRIADYKARQIIAEITGLRVNDGAMKHAAKMVFGNDKDPQSKFVYPDLSKEFPGYTFDMGKSSYRGEDPSEGGYVYAEPGIYRNVLYLDVASMHPKSLEMLNLFGPYTKNFIELRDARLYIKHGDFDSARKTFGGRLAPYLDDPNDAEALAYALKIFINTIYGYTSATFDCIFRDPRNIDNVVAKRGALFMIDLKHYLHDLGIKAVHFKTDSVKIADAPEGTFELVRDFGLKYGYEFEIEDTFDRMALVNDAVLVAKTGDGHWDAVGARFAEPYVYKDLFSKDPIVFRDHVVDRAVKKGVMKIFVDGEDPMYIGKVGQFVPVTKGGGELLRVTDIKSAAVTGTKGYKWLPVDMVEGTELESHIDLDYFRAKVDDAVAEINKFGDITTFLD